MSAMKQWGASGLLLALTGAAVLPACDKDNAISSEDHTSGAICPRGARYCKAETLVICNESQTDWVKLTCESEASCDAGLQFGVCGEDVDSGGVQLLCDFPLADCNVVAADGCETNLGTNVEHCGECGNDCAAPNADASCRNGECRLRCDAGFADCNGDTEDGCEVELETDEQHCGACGRACDDTNGSVACTNGLCTLVNCSPGYGDCDERPENGCETVTHTNDDHCGACGAPCTNAHGTVRCDDGRCDPTCEGGFGDCDGDGANGCETDLRSTVEHCGACGAACGGSEAVCVDGACDLACPPGMGDCDGDPENGCETKLDSPEHCGGCRVTCENEHGTSACEEGRCIPECDRAFSDCDGDPTNGCETSTATSAEHCGACGTVCASIHGTAICSSSECSVSCEEPYANCDHDPSNGCEVYLPGDTRHCGACGNVCSASGGTPACDAGQCALSCSGTLADCDALPATGCEVDTATSLEHCGGCNLPCGGDHATADCNQGVCQLECEIGFGDCDGDIATGCETPLTSNSQHCGRCGHSCLGGECRAGVCEPHVLADAESTPTTLRLDDGSVYWLASAVGEGTTIRQVAKTGGSAQDVVTSSAAICDFAVADSLAWTTPTDGVVWHGSKAGGQPVALASGQAGPCPIAMNGDWVVWADQTTDTIWKRSLATGSSNVEVATSVWAGAVYILGDAGYIGGEGVVGRFALSGGTISDELRLLHSTWHVEGIAADTAHLCYMQTMYGRVYCTSTATMAAPDAYLVQPGVTMMTSLALDDAFVYYLTPSAVERATIGAGAVNVVATSSHPRSLALDERGIYWTEPNLGRVMVLAKP